MTDTIRAVDLFCGAGGLSWGLARACEQLDREVELVAVNHWERAIETHEANHPWAEHHHARVEELRPREVVPDGHVDILVAGPECTHFSTARGGRPVSDQKRASPFHVLDWLEKLDVRNVLLENVPEFESWGPIVDGDPTRNGEKFDAYVQQLGAEGYAVDWRVLNAADHGDATSRRRFFLQARKGHRVEWPQPTHSEGGEEPGTRPWRPAAEIIDWSDPGESIWGRSRPLVANTMQRIAKGIRRYGDDRLEQYADAIADLDKDDVESMQETVIPARHAEIVAETIGRPFLVKYYGTSDARPLDEPIDTITSGGQKFALCLPYLLRQQSGGVPSLVDRPVPTIAGKGAISKIEPRAFVLPRNGHYRGLHSNPAYDPTERPLHTVTAKNHDGHLVCPSLMRFSHGGALLDMDGPLPTVTTARGGVFGLTTSYLVPFYGERENQDPRTHDLDEPLPTVPASKSPAGVCTPYLVQYNGESSCSGIGDPVPTIPTRDRFALVLPGSYPWGLDVRFRMLQPRELAAAMGFPPDYRFRGNKTETIEQIGNAVPVHLAESLCERLIAGDVPTVDSYGKPVAADGGEPADD